MRTRLSLLTTLLLLGAAAWPATARPQAGDDLETARARFEGTWQLVGGSSRAQQVVNRAVDQAVDAMPFFYRGIARDRLRDGTPVVRRIELTFGDAGALAVSFDGRRYETPIGQTRTRTRASDGERMRVTQRLRPDGQLEQVFQTDTGTRWYVYRATGPDALRVESTTNSDRMPQPLHFALDYHR